MAEPDDISTVIPEVDPQPLSGRVALVTGSGSSGGLGAGQSIAGVLGRAGASVVVNDIDRDAGEESLRWLTDAGIDAHLCVGDVSDDAVCAAMVQQAVEHFGGVDVLVNNVGIVGPSADVVAMAEDDWDQVMAVNVKSMMLMSKHSIPEMQPGRGSIINISSIGARVATDRPAYTASKGAVESLTLSLAMLHGPDGIRANCVAPGMMWTPMIRRQAPTPELADRIRENRKNAGHLPVEGTPWDIAQAVLFLASDQARWITAQVLHVDGGVLTVRPRGTAMKDLLAEEGN